VDAMRKQKGVGAEVEHLLTQPALNRLERRMMAKLAKSRTN
jgi:hypothetical protein